MRLFIALPVSSQVGRQVAALVSRLQQPGHDLRWMPPEAWHVTLQFLGDTTPQQYECLLPVLRTIYSSSFAIHLGETAFFERAGIFHIAVQPTAELLSLHQRVVTATSGCGFVAENRPYRPHITLARNHGRGPGIRRLKVRMRAAPSFGAFKVEEFLLYESFPHSTGSRYEVRARFPLQQG